MGFYFNALLPFVVFLGEILAGPSQHCTCPCQQRVELPKDLLDCVNIKSVKTRGWMNTDQNHMFADDLKRYVYFTGFEKQRNQNQNANWRLYTKPSYNKSYAIRSRWMLEFLFASKDDTRNTFSRYVLSWKKDYLEIPEEGYWQFIPAGKNQYRIRNTWSGEYLYVDQDNHYQVKGTKRPYTYRHMNYSPKPQGVDADLFEVLKCVNK
uniref:Putative conserved secreted protein n=1 Tax=Culex tarsalis TaxID=7177 RepID=A0A1Q3FTF7_CULTA